MAWSSPLALTWVSNEVLPLRSDCIIIGSLHVLTFVANLCRHGCTVAKCTSASAVEHLCSNLRPSCVKSSPPPFICGVKEYQQSLPCWSQFKYPNGESLCPHAAQLNYSPIQSASLSMYHLFASYINMLTYDVFKDLRLHKLLDFLAGSETHASSLAPHRRLRQGSQ